MKQKTEGQWVELDFSTLSYGVPAVPMEYLRLVKDTNCLNLLDIY